MDDLRVKVQQTEPMESIKKRFPNVDSARLEVKVGDKGQIQVIHQGSDRWYDLYQRKDPTKLNGKLSDQIRKALGEQNLTAQLQNKEQEIEALKKLEELEKIREEKERELIRIKKELEEAQRSDKEPIATLINDRKKALDERDRATQAFNLALQDLGLSKEENRNLKIIITGAIEDKRQLEARMNTMEELIRQRDQAIEDYERQIEELQRIANDNTRPEEEREAARRESETAAENRGELITQNENAERQLGRTTKEKIKRALLKYGLPLAFAVAVSSVVGVIINMLKATGAGVKKVGQGLTNFH